MLPAGSPSSVTLCSRNDRLGFFGIFSEISATSCCLYPASSLVTSSCCWSGVRSRMLRSMRSENVATVTFCVTTFSSSVVTTFQKVVTTAFQASGQGCCVIGVLKKCPWALSECPCLVSMKVTCLKKWSPFPGYWP